MKFNPGDKVFYFDFETETIQEAIFVTHMFIGSYCVIKIAHLSESYNSVEEHISNIFKSRKAAVIGNIKKIERDIKDTNKLLDKLHNRRSKMLVEKLNE